MLAPAPVIQFFRGLPFPFQADTLKLKLATVKARLPADDRHQYRLNAKRRLAERLVNELDGVQFSLNTITGKPFFNWAHGRNYSLLMQLLTLTLANFCRLPQLQERT